MRAILNLRFLVFAFLAMGATSAFAARDQLPNDPTPGYQGMSPYQRDDAIRRGQQQPKVNRPSPNAPSGYDRNRGWVEQHGTTNEKSYYGGPKANMRYSKEWTCRFRNTRGAQSENVLGATEFEAKRKCEERKNPGTVCSCSNPREVGRPVR